MIRLKANAGLQHSLGLPANILIIQTDMKMSSQSDCQIKQHTLIWSGLAKFQDTLTSGEGLKDVTICFYSLFLPARGCAES